MTRIGPPRIVLPLLIAMAAPGCGRGPSGANRSPTPEQDPERFERALAETDELIRGNREAERAALRGLAVPDGE